MDTPACAEARRTLAPHIALPSGQNGVLWLAIEGFIEIEEGTLGDHTLERAAEHVAGCDRCQAWLDQLFPERVAARERAKRYCCTSMNLAVNDPQASLRFEFMLFRGEEPCWMVNDGIEFVRYCPWCGRPLPPHPFEQPPPA